MTQPTRTLTCQGCERQFEHVIGPGRPPLFCPECRETKKKKQSSWKDGARTSHVMLRIYDADVRMLDLIQKDLGVNRSEAARTAIRVYAGLLMNSKR